MAESQRTAIYAGTFDPLTHGHRDVIERASRIFERVVVAIAESSPKDVLFPGPDRKALIEQALGSNFPGVEVKIFKGLLVDFVRQEGGMIIIRGLRAVSDYEYEAQMAMINRRLAPEIETAFLVTSMKHSFVSSSLVKQIARNGGDVSEFVPANVAARLKEIYASPR